MAAAVAPTTAGAASADRCPIAAPARCGRALARCKSPRLGRRLAAVPWPAWPALGAPAGAAAARPVAVAGSTFVRCRPALGCCCAVFAPRAPCLAASAPTSLGCGYRPACRGPNARRQRRWHWRAGVLPRRAVAPAWLRRGCLQMARQRTNRAAPRRRPLGRWRGKSSGRCRSAGAGARRRSTAVRARG